MDKNKIHIILGTAHLGTTPGKCSPDKKFREALWSREMCDQVKLILENAKYQVHIDYPSLEPSQKMKKAGNSRQTAEPGKTAKQHLMTGKSKFASVS